MTTVSVVRAGGVALAVWGVILLCACSSDGQAGAASPVASESGPLGPVASGTGTPTSSPSTTPASPSTTPASAPPTETAVAFPTDCRALIAGSTSAQTFDTFPLNDPKVVGSPPVIPTTYLTSALAAGTSPLFCVWRAPEADITYLAIEVVRVDPAAAARVFDAMPADGFTCSSLLDGRQCQYLSKDTMYRVDLGDTFYTRGSIGIRIDQANVATHGLMADVVRNLF